MLRCFTQIFVQNEESKKLLETINVNHCAVSGDTRFDTVIEIAEKFEPILAVETFIQNKKAIVAGSTWRKDEELLQIAFNKLPPSSVNLIIAPHEIHSAHLDELKKRFPDSPDFQNSHSTHSLQAIFSSLTISACFHVCTGMLV